MSIKKTDSASDEINAYFMSHHRTYLRLATFPLTGWNITDIEDRETIIDRVRQFGFFEETSEDLIIQVIDIIAKILCAGVIIPTLCMSLPLFLCLEVFVAPMHLIMFTLVAILEFIIPIDSDSEPETSLSPAF
ncbi:hypothetical protein [Legionella worsleiensis]|uniref:Uncharacterized protein n=1 Tax=Legionella worsleiensis TaxID=45076 RepID=A0A0W1A9A7_9GAMM|nr:hypothetical protein [Legionella worsleiensis]KTD77878.1 hypothetical protein Lwor_1760 [Legionella worsleiensis]STY33123.1 Uncharacterised protein [Legionella worsleiensis]